MREAIIIAGGFGSRLKKVVSNLPKPMAPVAGRPFLEILLNNFAQNGFNRIILALGFMADTIINHFGQKFAGMEIVYVREDIPLGTGGAVKLAMKASFQDHVFIFNGDSFLNLEIDKVEHQWKLHKLPIIVGCNVPDTTRYGRLLTKSGMVVGFSEKGIIGPGLINAGCYILNRGQLNDFPDNVAFSLETDFFSKIVTKSAVNLFVSSGYFIDIGIPEDYARAQIEIEFSNN